MAQIAGAVTTIAKRMTALEKHSDLSRKAVNLTHDDLAAVRARLNQLEKKIDALAAKSG
jgi:ubiquinone biosynthesis protein UbiJ